MLVLGVRCAGIGYIESAGMEADRGPSDPSGIGPRLATGRILGVPDHLVIGEKSSADEPLIAHDRAQRRQKVGCGIGFNYEARRANSQGLIHQVRIVVRSYEDDPGVR